MRTEMKPAAVLLLSAVAFVAGAARAQEAPDLVRGRKLFDAHCARCHSIGGTGGEGPSLVRPTLRHAADDATLFTIVQEGIEGTKMPGTWTLSDVETWDVVGYVRSLGRLEPESLSGDPIRGRELFEGRLGCGVCHVVRGEGGVFGPELSDIGLRRGAAHLRESIVEPGATVDPAYVVVTLRTPEGDEIRGARVNEDSFTLQVRDATGELRSFAKRELSGLDKKFGESLMPSYAGELDESELEDLVAYLASLRGTP